MRSFFVGFGWVMLLTVLAPFTLMWIVGERIQGRVGIVLHDGGFHGETKAGVCIVLSTAAWMIGAIIVGAFLLVRSSA